MDMGKKIKSGDQIQNGARVKVIRRFAILDVESMGTIVDFNVNENGIVTELVIDWDKSGVLPYVIDDVVDDSNIVNFIELEK